MRALKIGLWRLTFAWVNKIKCFVSGAHSSKIKVTVLNINYCVLPSVKQRIYTNWEISFFGLLQCPITNNIRGQSECVSLLLLMAAAMSVNYDKLISGFMFVRVVTPSVFLAHKRIFLLSPYLSCWIKVQFVIYLFVGTVEGHLSLWKSRRRLICSPI